jgi:hypothetical protein
MPEAASPIPPPPPAAAATPGARIPALGGSFSSGGVWRQPWMTSPSPAAAAVTPGLEEIPALGGCLSNSGAHCGDSSNYGPLLEVAAEPEALLEVRITAICYVAMLLSCP